MANEISIRQWSKRGMMLINTSALEHDDPDHPYNQALAQGVRPEDYGLKHPLSERFEGKTRDELISMIVALEKEVEGYAKHLA